MSKRTALDGGAAQGYSPSGLIDYPQNLEYKLKNEENQIEQRSKVNQLGEWALLLLFVRKEFLASRHRITSH